ncbi:hypothetical protein Pla175_35620 [Pirellulimonas nuda]|uniref:DUF1549 domain-containing protein n=1 Tax=Pirellulimonas nuda TaxID=2528009 RepID=A0A518DFA4_9BACT|nr:hypothetical protein [Pirellulimonas nuda]QDU90161.1 hypothetical protein Pla175_35620 [Pirellulimonas nuda]
MTLKPLPQAILLRLPVLLAALGASPAPADTAVVLLHNGAVMRGEVRLLGEQVRIENPGSEITLRPSQVAKIAASVEELYAWRRTQLVSPLPGEHIDLAEWCQQNELWKQAAQQLLQAKALTPGDPRIAPAQQRLMAAWQRAERGEPASSAPAKTTTTITPPDAGVPSLPEGALAEFSRRVQPILVNNCTTAGCHQAGGSEVFQLDRGLVYGHGDRRSTLTNLMAVLSAIDREAPGDSPLLQAARTPHGGADQPWFIGRRVDQLERVAAWVELVAPTPEAAESAVADSRQEGPVRQASYEAPSDGGPENPYAYLSKPGAAEAAFGTPDTLPGDDVRPETPAEAYRPRDPFDAEAFNRARRSP